MRFFKYLSYLVRHRWHVMVECFKLGLYWRGITHDLSKFLPSEFTPYMNYFNGDIDKTGYYKPTSTGNEAFDFAWLLHQKRNRHHWQWWILPRNGSSTKVLPMPNEYLLEMICDWRGAGKAQGHGSDPAKWYWEHKDKMQLHPQTRAAIEAIFPHDLTF